MSWDFAITDAPCASCGKRDAYEWHGCTYNLGPIWRRGGIDPSDFDGGLAKEWAPKFRAAVTDMEAHPQAYRALNPPNGWGDFDRFLPLLREMTEFLETHPEATIHVS